MSFQAYLDNIEEKTGKTPREFIARQRRRGSTLRDEGRTIVDWLKTSTALAGSPMPGPCVKGPQISDKHIGSGGTHSDESNVLRLDGKKNR